MASRPNRRAVRAPATSAGANAAIAAAAPGGVPAAGAAAGAANNGSATTRRSTRGARGGDVLKMLATAAASSDAHSQAPASEAANTEANNAAQAVAAAALAVQTASQQRSSAAGGSSDPAKRGPVSADANDRAAKRRRTMALPVAAKAAPIDPGLDAVVARAASDAASAQSPAAIASVVDDDGGAPGVVAGVGAGAGAVSVMGRGRGRGKTGRPRGRPRGSRGRGKTSGSSSLDPIIAEPETAETQRARVTQLATVKQGNASTYDAYLRKWLRRKVYMQSVLVGSDAALGMLTSLQRTTRGHEVDVTDQFLKQTAGSNKSGKVRKFVLFFRSVMFALLKLLPGQHDLRLRYGGPQAQRNLAEDFSRAGSSAGAVLSVIDTINKMVAVVRPSETVIFPTDVIQGIASAAARADLDGMTCKDCGYLQRWERCCRVHCPGVIRAKANKTPRKRVPKGTTMAAAAVTAAAAANAAPVMNDHIVTQPVHVSAGAPVPMRVDAPNPGGLRNLKAVDITSTAPDAMGSRARVQVTVNAADKVNATAST